MENFWQILKLATIADFIDIAIVAYLFYWVIKRIRHTSAERLLKGIFLILIITQLSDVFELHTIHFLLENTIQLGLIAVVIIFQPELRKILEQFGKSKIKLFKTKEIPDDSMRKSISEITKAAASMSWSKIGALIVFERNDKLDSIVNTGTIVDAEISEQVIRNIFYPKAPLHDGAVIISENRVKAAGCLLPLSSNLTISKDLGTRHRAGLGTSEISDAIVLIVSEETGTITLVENGVLKRHLATETLERLLIKGLLPEGEENTKQSFWKRFKRGEK